MSVASKFAAPSATTWLQQGLEVEELLLLGRR